jgi:hypothetical protein
VSSKRTASWLAWSICALSLALTGLSLLLLYLNYHLGVHIYDYWLENTVIPVSFSIAGAIIAPRLPNHPMGWLFCAIGFLVGLVAHFAGQYAIYTMLAAPGSLPGGEVAAWVNSWAWIIPSIGLLLFLLLLFPTGTLPSSRWKWFAGLAVAVTLVGVVSSALSCGPVAGLGPIQNPVCIEGFSNIYEGGWSYLAAVTFFGAAASQFVRMRRAREVERQQIKWFAYAATVTASGPILAYVIPEATGARWLAWPGLVLFIAGLLGIPMAMGIAILRYRLYEIDLIINRTLVYGALTATLALLYFGSVTALQYLLSLLTGQGNTLAIVASTLAIAALFNPLRRRIQSFIDRRFYRRKYDARKTLEAFGSRLRHETDLERISEDLLEVVDETMQPSHISLWLRVPASTSPPERSKKSRSSSTEVRSSMQSEPPTPPE